MSDTYKFVLRKVAIILNSKNKLCFRLWLLFLFSSLASNVFFAGAGKA